MLRYAVTPSIREPRLAPQDSPAALHPSELGKGRARIDILRVQHLDLSRRFLEVHGRALYEIDLVLVAAMARSYSLVDGFTCAFDSWNPVVAAPLLRMQIDSLVRLAYIATNPQADEIAQYVVGGGEFRALKDADGKKLTDQRLLEHAETAHAWIARVYKATSGWVHFSPVHLRATWQLDQDDAADQTDINIFGAVPIRPEQIPLGALQELLGAMIRATEELFGYVQAWEQRKGLPSGETRAARRD
jgi:hypothetical protein